MKELEEKKLSILKAKQEKLEALNVQLESFDIVDVEQNLLKAIIEQDWYSFRNKELILFDKRNCFLFQNFKNSDPILFTDWDETKSTFAPHDIGENEWDIDRIEFQPFHYPPKKFRCDQSISILYFFDGVQTYSCCSCFSPADRLHNHNIVVTDKLNKNEKLKNCYTLPKIKILNDNKLYSHNLTKSEKAKIILDFFIDQDWIPNFDPFIYSLEVQTGANKDNERFDYYHKYMQLSKEISTLKQQIANYTEEESSVFNYKIEIEKYNLLEINSSTWKYTLSVQQWINYLLNQIDSWGSKYQNSLNKVSELNKKLEINTISLNVNEIERELLNSQNRNLQKKMNLSLDSLQSKLVDLLHQSKEIEKSLLNAHSLIDLAQLESQKRPSFSFLAEHTAMLFIQTLKKLEWLEKSIPFVSEIIKYIHKSKEDYLVLVDKYQQNLLNIGLDANIEKEEVTKWFIEWRQERLKILQQLEPLIEASFNSIISEQTTLEVLIILNEYQISIDHFYLNKRLGIHTTFAFHSNGHRQEELETKQELTKLNHIFMRKFERVIFSAITTAEKIWLIRYSEVWQKNIIEEISSLLANESFINCSDLIQIISEDMRKIQRQNLTSCLQDANIYSEALAQREKDLNTLIFKMRKALQK